MSLTLSTALTLLDDVGFIPHDQVPHFGSELAGVSYLYCLRGAHHVYISLVTYEGVLVEIIHEVYLKPKNTRAPKARATKRAGAEYTDHQLNGFASVRCDILRSEADLRAAIS